MKSEESSLIKIYNQPIRIKIINQKYFLAGKDVASILNYSNPSDTIKKLVAKEDKRRIKINTNGGIQEVVFINEAGLFSLISKSRNISINEKNNIVKQFQSIGLLKKYSLYSRKEINFKDKLKQALKPFGLKIIPQFQCLNYKIDFYIKSLNIAIEYDENDHKNYSYEKHEGRQKEIEKELGCRFIRISDKNTDEYNIGYVIKEIFEL